MLSDAGRRADAGSATAGRGRLARRHRRRRCDSRTARQSGWAASPCPASAADPGLVAAGARRGSVLSLFRESVAFMDCANWATGQVGRVTVSLNAPVRASVHACRRRTIRERGQCRTLFSSSSCSASLFLVDAGRRAVLGRRCWRDRSPHAVHELFVGTERVAAGRLRPPDPRRLAATSWATWRARSTG